MGMASIEVDERVAALLRDQAEARQLPLSDFLQKLAISTGSINTDRPISDDEWERAIDEGTGEFPVLPPAFSRAEIYSDHD
jgi:hypothetical protein